MCLHITKNKRAVKKSLKKSTVYKVYQRYRNEDYVMACFQYNKYPDCDFQVGKEIISDRTTTELDLNDIQIGLVGKGLHAYTLKKDAALAVDYWNEYHVHHHFIVEMEGLPKNFVARGEDDAGKPSVVYTKLKILKIHK